MYFTKCLILIMTVPLCCGTVVENYEKNISCNDIKTASGFKFPHNGNEKSEITVTSNKTVIAHALLGKQSFEYFSDVMNIDNYSVITRDCRDLEIKCIVPDGKFVREICIYYRIIEKVKNPEPTDSPTPWDLIIGVTSGVALISGLFNWYLCRKKMKKQHSAAPVDDEPVNDQTEIQMTMLSEIPSTPGPLESGENDTERDVESIDPMADGKTPQALSLYHNFNHDGIQPFENGDASDPDSNRASTHRAIHRDDPGGFNDKGIRKTHNGCTLGVQTPEDHENEGQPLLLNQRAAIQDFDMKGEAADLVNKHDFDQHQVSGCPTAPETDVESTRNMKNHTHI